MTTQTFRVVRVLSGHSPVARIDGVDKDGHELRIEVPTEMARAASVDQLLVVNWSLQALPVAPNPVESGAATPATVVDAEFSTSRSPSTSRGSVVTPKANNNPHTDATAVDREFMALMSGGRSARASPAVTSRDIDHELNTLLGGAEAKGQK